MLFKKGEEQHHRKRHSNPISGLIRLSISLVLLLIIAYFGLRSYIYFSGIDPTSISPKQALSQIISSESAVDFIISLLNFRVPSDLSQLQDPKKFFSTTQTEIRQTSPELFKFAIVTDSHNDNQLLKVALDQAKERGVRFVIGLGDYSDVGTSNEIREASQIFKDSGITYYSTAGDHDLWDCRNRNLDPLCNFSPNFGSAYQSFAVSGVRFIVLYNSDNYLGVDGLQLDWIREELEKVATDKPIAVFGLMSIPLYHPSSDHVMGKTTPSLKNQATEIIDLFSSVNTSHLFAGDTHFYTSYSEPKTGLKMTTVGAITSERNTQAPRFAIVTVYEDGGYLVEDIPLVVE